MIKHRFIVKLFITAREYHSEMCLCVSIYTFSFFFSYTCGYLFFAKVQKRLQVTCCRNMKSKFLATCLLISAYYFCNFFFFFYNYIDIYYYYNYAMEFVLLWYCALRAWLTLIRIYADYELRFVIICK